MRSAKEITKDVSDVSKEGVSVQQEIWFLIKLQLEILLDIRELLKKKGIKNLGKISKLKEKI